MADKSKDDTVKSESDGSKRVNGDETTTANDGELAINKAPESATSTTPATPAAPHKDAIDSPAVVLSEADIAAAQKENDPHESLGEQIEVLTGEVQALEAKIEKLTSGVGENASAVASSVPNKSSDETIVSTPPPVQPANPEPLVVPNLKEPAKPTPEIIKPEIKEPAQLKPTPPVSALNQSTKPVNDIYTKILADPKGKTPPSDHKDLNDEATIDEGTTGIGTIGEVLIVFGILALLVLFASPFFKSILSSNWEAVKSIGWPTATISLLLGFLLFFFNRGRVALKILAFILFVLAALMTVLVFDYGSMLGPLEGILEPIASFYR